MVDLPVLVQVSNPGSGLVQGAYLGECESECVDPFPCIGSRSAGGVAADNALGVDEASLDFCGGPALLDRAVRALSAVKDDA